MAMFHCTDKKIALKGNLADYINKRGGVSKVTKLPSFRKEGWLKAGVVGGYTMLIITDLCLHLPPPPTGTPPSRRRRMEILPTFNQFG